jgi:hypothetical protein
MGACRRSAAAKKRAKKQKLCNGNPGVHRLEETQLGDLSAATSVGPPDSSKAKVLSEPASVIPERKPAASEASFLSLLPSSTLSMPKDLLSHFTEDSLVEIFTILKVLDRII